jgi:cysteine desulfurase
MLKERIIYLDHVVTTRLPQEVFAEMEPYFTRYQGVVSSAHQDGLCVREALKLARERVAQFLHAPDLENIIFTSSGTEAANLAIKGLAHANRKKGMHVVCGAIEHPSVLFSLQALQLEGFELTVIPVDKVGRIDPVTFREALRPDTVLAAVHVGNHDLGTLQPVKEFAKIAHANGSLIYVDACAAVGWVSVDVEELDVDVLSASSHHFFGPKGVGILYIKKGVLMEPLIHGGKQEYGLRAGTENVPAIVGAGKACELAQVSLCENHARSLSHVLWNELKQHVPQMDLNGPPVGTERLPHHLSIRFDGVEGEALMLRLDLQNVAVASVTGCMVKSMKVPYTLRAIELTDKQALSTLLMGVDPSDSTETMVLAAGAIAEAVAKLRAMSPKKF